MTFIYPGDQGPLHTDRAWCAGLYDGEGSTGCYTFRSTKRGRISMIIGQKTPEVLYRFRLVVGVGKVAERYNGSRGGKPHQQWAWAVYQPMQVYDVGSLLWPWLGEVKRE